MPGNLSSALIYIISAITTIVVFVFMLRFLLPLLRADFRNPIAQGLLRITAPVVVPIRRIVPSIGSIDTATILVAFAVQFLFGWLIQVLFAESPRLDVLAFMSVIELAVITIRIFIFAIFISIILSWIAPGQYSPISGLTATISEPVLRPFRRFIPSLGGFDISPIFAIILLTALTMVVGGLRPFWI
jgi:YggT family protein